MFSAMAKRTQPFNLKRLRVVGVVALNLAFTGVAFVAERRTDDYSFFKGSIQDSSRIRLLRKLTATDALLLDKSLQVSPVVVAASRSIQLAMIIPMALCSRMSLVWMFPCPRYTCSHNTLSALARQAIGVARLRIKQACVLSFEAPLTSFNHATRLASIGHFEHHERITS